MPNEPDNMKSNLSKNNTTKRATALYCNTYIDGDLDIEITQALKAIMVNVNGEKRRPLGAITKIPLKINNHIIPFDNKSLNTATEIAFTTLLNDNGF
ncbi:7957_t:CDS:2 [Funneliformis geosporum]|uniref:7957_t:CDS:1 n=1 Tax=Funneliformis geosporum TaxID=1117311 RepID=A0A9W4SPR7_9GLOM|nr:7957_t:CDS:2 [Funneliformis geosporum]